MTTANPVTKLQNALPFWISVLLVPLVWIGATQGGWLLLLAPIYALIFTSVLDHLTGLNTDNPDTETPDAGLFWYRLVTLIWFPLQITTQLGLIWWVTHTNHLSIGEKILLFYALGLMTGGVGIVYAHELMHQKSKLERWLADLLLASVLYGHFRSEHLLVHHTHVGTPKDSVTARYNEGFHRFFVRVVPASLFSAFQAEAAMLRRRNKLWHHPSNPFWRYWVLQALMILLVISVGGLEGIIWLIVQAFFAISVLELTNYVEHYGLTRKHIGDGKYEHIKPHHSWNAEHRATNWLLINLQRHSDHHYKPSRRFPLLQTYDANEAPQLPMGYPAMTAMALIPPLWRARMNPRVRAWRRQYYPEIEEWGPYNKATNPVRS